jgi:hypothetical protein
MSLYWSHSCAHRVDCLPEPWLRLKGFGNFYWVVSFLSFFLSVILHPFITTFFFCIYFDFTSRRKFFLLYEFPDVATPHLLVGVTQTSGWSALQASFLQYKASSFSNEWEKLIPLTGCGGLQGCEMLRIPHCLDNLLTVNCEILATCNSTYSPVRTSEEAHSVSIK